MTQQNTMPDTAWLYITDNNARNWSLKHTKHHHRMIPYFKTEYIKLDLHNTLLQLEYERGRRDALWSIMEAKREPK